MARNSQIILSKNILVDKEHKNVLNFTNGQIIDIMQNQEHFVARANDYSFIQGSSNQIIVGFTYEQCLTANYIAFQNPNYSTKWFFAWIDEVTFYSPNATKINFTIDNWATWFEKLNFKPCYTIREHVTDDTIGINTVPEDLAVPEVVAESSTTDTDLDVKHYLVIETNWLPDSKTGYSGITVKNGGVMGAVQVLFKADSMEGLEDLLDAQYFIAQTNEDGHIADIKNMYLVPARVIEEEALSQHHFEVSVPQFVGKGCYYYQINASKSKYNFSAITNNITIPKRRTFSDYTPKNNKLFCYPYNYLFVSNNNGASNIYKYEDFIDTSNPNNCVFQQQFAMAIGCSGRTVPRYYKKIIENLDEALPLGKYPTCSWSADSYTNWLTQNAVNIDIKRMNLEFGAMNTVSSIFTANLGGAVSGVQNVANQAMGLIGSFYEASLLPSIQGGTNTGDVNYSSKDSGWKYIQMRAKTEYLQVIDDFFTRFGYKINRTKIPNITGRPNFNYIEIGTGEKFAYGEVPANALDEINKIARSGVTIWHNHDIIGNYDVNNK